MQDVKMQDMKMQDIKLLDTKTEANVSNSCTTLSPVAQRFTSPSGVVTFCVVGARDKNTAFEPKMCLLGLKKCSQTTPIGAANILRGAIVTRKHTQLIVAITGGATVLRVGYKRMLRAERRD